MSSENQGESNLLVIKFDGDRLENRSIPISDLANTLLSIQRIINKAYLAKTGNLIEHARIGKEDRDYVSLQVVSHDKGSDIYSLSSFLTDPVTQEIVKDLVVQIVAGMGVYTAQNVVKKLGELRKKKLKNSHNETEESKDRQQTTPISDDPDFLSSIFNEVKNINRNIRDGGVITNIQISISNNKDIPVVIFDQNTRFYTQVLENEKTYGEYQEIEGQIKSFLPGTNIITIRKKYTRNKVVKVYFSRQDFEKIKKSDIRILRVGGRPIFSFGKFVDEDKFDEFEAITIISAEG